MFDLLGVGLCIACLSYLCCIYTTSFVTVSAPKRHKKHPGCAQVIYRSPVVQPCRDNQNAPITSTCTISSETCSSRRRCACTEAGRVEKKNLGQSEKVPNKRKLCLVAASFLDFEETDSECNGTKYKRTSEKYCYSPASEKHSTCEVLYSKSSKQTDCRA